MKKYERKVERNGVFFFIIRKSEIMENQASQYRDMNIYEKSEK